MEWWKEKYKFFDKEYLDYFAPIMLNNVTIEQVNFIGNFLKNRSEIMDIAGGSGRHVIELAKKGFKCTLLDVNKEFLLTANKLAKKEGVVINTLNRDMRNINFYEKFDAVLCMCTSFGYFHDEKEHAKIINSVFKSLKKQGMFILDLDNRERIIKHFKKYEWFETLKGFVLREANINLTNNRLEEKIVRINMKKNIYKEHFISIRMFTLNEISSILVNAGFKINKVFGSYNLEDVYNVDASRMIILCQKKY